MKRYKNKYRIGEKYFLTENTRTLLGLPDGYEYELIDILKIKVNSPYVIKCEELGEDWRGFVDKHELIKIKK